VFYLALLVCAAGSASSVDDRTAEAALRQQIRHLEKVGNFRAAAALYQQLRQLAPGDSAAVHGLVRAWEAAARHQQVVDLLEPWLREHPDDLQAYLRLGDARRGLGADRRAVKAWRRALQRRPEQPGLYLQISDRCQAAGLHAEAVQVLLDGRRALGRETLFGWELAQLYLRQEDYRRSVDAYLASLRENPERFPLVEKRLLQLMGDAAAAPEIVKALTAALKTGDDSLQVSLLTASCALERGDPETGFRLLVAVAHGPENAPVLFQYASRCEEAGYDQTAVRTYALFAKRSPESPYLYQALLRQAGIASRRRNYARAVELYRQLVHQFPDQPEALEALFHLGRLQLEELDDLEGARASLQTVLQAPHRSQWTYGALALMAECDLRAGELNEAETRLDELQRWDPRSAYQARYRQAELRYLQTDFRGATEILEGLLAADPAHELANDALSLLLLCEDLQDQSPSLEVFVRAHLQERRRRPDAAAQDWDWLAVHAPPPLQELSLLTRARIREERQEHQAALALYERLVRQHPESRYGVQARMNAGRLYEQQGHLDQALKTYETALLAAPDDARAPEIRLRIQRLRRRIGKGSG